MKGFNFNLWSVVVSVLLLTTLTNTSGYYDYYDNKTKHTEEEAILIAQSDPEVNEWLNQTDGLIVAVEVNYEYWHLMFESQTNSSYLQVIVDDVSGVVISINYQNNDNRWHFYDDNTLRFEAEKYFLELNESSAFVEMNLDINIAYSGMANYMDVWGWGWSSENNLDMNMNALIKFNLTQSGYIFSLAFINSNIQFGDPNYTFTEAEDETGVQSSVQDFYGNYTVHEITIRQWLINDDFRRWPQENKMRDLPTGYYYEIRYLTWDYYQEVSTTTVTFPTLDSSTMEIEIIFDGTNWHEVILSDLTGEIVKDFGTLSNTRSYQEIVDLILADPEILEWLATTTTPYIYVRYDGYGIFFVDIWANGWYESANFVISDDTGEFLSRNINRAIYPTKSYEDVLSIALSTTKISNWILSTEDYRVNYYYDFQGQWNLNFFDPLISDSWADIAINDTNGFIFYSEAYIGQLPEMSKDDVINIALSIDLTDFYNNHPDAIISMFYNYDDDWWVYIYSPVVLEEYILIIIDDDNGRIQDQEYNRASSLPDSTYSDVEAAMLVDPDYQEFVSSYSVQYQTIYFFNNYWYVYVEGFSTEGYLVTFEMGITDSNERVQYASTVETLELSSRAPRGEEMQWQLQNEWDSRYVGKQPSTPLGDVIEGYVLISSTTTTSNENTSPSLALDGFSLLPSLVAIFAMIPIYLKRKK